MPLTIRPEQSSDCSAIAALTLAAFANAPHSSHTEHLIVRELRSAGALSVSLVAEASGAIIGHVALSPVSISSGERNWYGLGPISVAPEQQGQGLGSQLMRAALDALRALGADGCVLLGDPDFYSRFGFRPLAGLILPDVPPEYFQALPLGLQTPQGTVSYHPAFAAQE